MRVVDAVVVMVAASVGAAAAAAVAVFALGISTEYALASSA